MHMLRFLTDKQSWWARLLKKSRWTQKLVNDPQYFDCRKNSWGHACEVMKKRDPSAYGSQQVYTIDEHPNDKPYKDYYVYPDAGCYVYVNGHLSPHLRPGDYILLSFKRGPTLFRAVHVENVRDPQDMFWAILRFMKYLTVEEATNYNGTFQVSEAAKIMLEGRTPQSHPDQYYPHWLSRMFNTKED
jgi:hypothetical protein